MRTYISLFSLLFFNLSIGLAQEKSLPENDLVQFSGIVVTSDSLNPVPYTSIMIRNTYRGTVGDYYGFFSFVAKMKDTIEFLAIGYKRAVFVIPDTLSDHRCSLIQLLKPDTVYLREVVIFPWPTKEQFKEAFLRLHIPSDDMTRAERNLDPGRLAMLSAAMPMDEFQKCHGATNQQIVLCRTTSSQ